jgi:hypothetical protein
VLGVVSLAEQGIGICQSYDFIVRERLRRGQLVEVLPQLREDRGRSRRSMRRIGGSRRRHGR